jgi:heme/copper-type cytochrome/quinol oxidase subunit 4
MAITMDLATALNLAFGIVVLSTAIAVAYALVVFIEFRKKTEFRWKLMVVIVLTSLLLVCEIAFGVWYFLMKR